VNDIINYYLEYSWTLFKGLYQDGLSLGGGINWIGAATAYTTTWWVTVAVYCVPQVALPFN